MSQALRVRGKHMVLIGILEDIENLRSFTGWRRAGHGCMVYPLPRQRLADPGEGVLERDENQHLSAAGLHLIQHRLDAGIIVERDDVMIGIVHPSARDLE